MIFDAVVALLLVKFFELEGLYSLIAVAMVCVIRTCNNVNWIIRAIEQETITVEEEE